MASNVYDGIKIGEQDRQLFMLLLKYKCLTRELIQRWLSPDTLDLPEGKRSPLYYRLYRLINAGYIKKQALQGRDVYLLEKKGMDEVRDLNRNALSLVNFTELTTINHDITVASVGCYFESHGIRDWVSERELLQFPGKLPQVPDGGFVYRGLSVFVEIELSRKSLERYRAIASIYTGPKGPNRVLYLYQDPSVVEPLIELTRHHERLGFFTFDPDMTAPDKIVGVSQGCEMRLSQFLRLEA